MHILTDMFALMGHGSNILVQNDVTEMSYSLFTIVTCIDILYHRISKLSFFAYFDRNVFLKSVRFLVFPGFEFWAHSLKWFLKDVDFRKEHQKSYMYKYTNQYFMCISCLTIRVFISTWVKPDLRSDKIKLYIRKNLTAAFCDIVG